MANDVFQKTAGNHVEFFREGNDYYSRYLEIIQGAQRTIHLQTYIFEEDAFGSEVMAVLMASAERGVKIYLLVDSVGSFGLSEEAEERLRAAGIKFCRFNGIQFRWLGKWGRRLHHKVLLADHSRAFIGGINVVSESYKNEQVVPHQLDFAVYLEGPATVGLTHYCQSIFKGACPEKSRFETISNHDIKTFPDGVSLRISINDWIYRRWRITRQYGKLTRVAKDEIVIANSYFFPRWKFMRQLKAAAKRGVRVRLLLPRFSDWQSYVKASRYLYGYFFKHGIEVYEWKESIMHGKLAIIDDAWSTIGSFNLNYTSYQQNLEMNVDIFDETFTKKLNQEIQTYLDQGSEKIEPESFLRKRKWHERISHFFYYLILSLLANLSIGLAFQEEEARTQFYKIILISASLSLLIVGIIGLILPAIPGFPFLVLGLILLVRQIISNNRNV